MPEFIFSDMPIDMVIDQIFNLDRQGQLNALESFKEHSILLYFLQDYSLAELREKMKREKEIYSELKWFITFKPLLNLSYFKDLSIDISDSIKELPIFEQLLLNSYIDDDGLLISSWHKQFPNILGDKIIKFDAEKEVFRVNYDVKYTQMIHQSKYLTHKVQPYVFEIRKINKIAIQLMQMVEQYSELADLIPKYFHSFLTRVLDFEKEINKFLTISWGDLLDSKSDLYHQVGSILSMFESLRNEINNVHDMYHANIRSIISLSRFDLINHSDEWKSAIDLLNSDHPDYNNHLNNQIFKVLNLTIECMSLTRWMLIPIDISDCFVDYKTINYTIICTTRSAIYKLVKRLYNIPLHFKGLNHRIPISPNKSIYSLVETQINYFTKYLPCLHDKLATKIANHDFSSMESVKIGVFYFDFKSFNDHLSYLNAQYLQQSSQKTQSIITDLIASISTILELIQNDKKCSNFDFLAKLIKQCNPTYYNALINDCIKFKVNISNLRSLKLKIDAVMPLIISWRVDLQNKQFEIASAEIKNITAVLDSPSYKTIYQFSYSYNQYQNEINTFSTLIQQLKVYSDNAEVQSEFNLNARILEYESEVSFLKEWVARNPAYFKCQDMLNASYLMYRDQLTPLITSCSKMKSLANISSGDSTSDTPFSATCLLMIKIIGLIRFDIYTDFDYILQLLKLDKSYLKVTMLDLLKCDLNEIEINKFNNQAILIKKTTKLVNDAKSVHFLVLKIDISGVPSSNYDDLLIKVDETISELVMIMNTPLIASTKLAIEEISEECTGIKSLLIKIRDLQLKWIKIKNIVYNCTTPISKIEFNKLNEHCASYLHMVNDKSLIQVLHLNHTNLNEHIIALNKVEDQIVSYLNTKRNSFHRFYFLSNDELLYLLSNYKDVQILNKFMCRFITACKSLIINKNNIVGIQSDLERVMFNNPVEITAIETMLPRIINESQSTLAQQLIDVLNKQKSEFCNQIMQISEMITFTSKCEECLISRKYNQLQVTSSFTHLKNIQEYIISDLLIHKPQVDSLHWIKFIRYYLLDDVCIVKHFHTSIPYGYEYILINELVFTHQTWKCMHVALLAYQVGIGPNPSGPAGTGKTETIKYLGALLGKQVIVFNCDATINYNDFKHSLLGVIASQQWGCFDEFNRLNVKVMGLISSELSLMLNAQYQRLKEVKYMDITVKVPSTITAITMNPSSKLYGARNELPSVIRDIFKTILMENTDMYKILNNIIAHADLIRVLEYCVTLSHLLIKSPINEFGLRTLKPILLSKPEDLLLQVYIVLLNRLEQRDILLFKRIFKVNTSNVASNLAANVVQSTTDLFKSRTGVCYVGPHFTGKSTTAQLLLKAYTELSKDMQVVILDPKSMLIETLYIILSTYCVMDNALLIFDGLIDPNWVELLNSSMDDNKLLTLPSGQRIMLKNIKFLFICTDISYASPATISRIGIIHFNDHIEYKYTNEIVVHVGSPSDEGTGDFNSDGIHVTLYCSKYTTIHDVYSFLDSNCVLSGNDYKPKVVGATLHIYSPEITSCDEYGSNVVLNFFHFISKYRYYYNLNGILMQISAPIVLHVQNIDRSKFSRFIITNNKYPLYRPASEITSTTSAASRTSIMDTETQLPFWVLEKLDLIKLYSTKQCLYFISELVDLNDLLSVLSIQQVRDFNDISSSNGVVPFIVNHSNKTRVINYLINNNTMTMPIIRIQSVWDDFINSSPVFVQYHRIEVGLLNDKEVNRMLTENGISAASISNSSSTTSNLTDAVRIQYLLDSSKNLYLNTFDKNIQHQQFINRGLSSISNITNHVIALKLDIKLQIEKISQSEVLANEAMAALQSTLIELNTLQSKQMELMKSMEEKQSEIKSKQLAISNELSMVQPILDASKMAINNIEKDTLTELKSLRQPPASVEVVLQAVFIILGIKDTSWLAMKSFLGNKQIKQQLMTFDPADCIFGNELHDFIIRNPINPSAVGSAACVPLAEWVLATDVYCQTSIKCKPFNQQLEKLQLQSAASTNEIGKIQSQLSQIQANVSSSTLQFQNLTSSVEKSRLLLLQLEEQLNDAEWLIIQFNKQSKEWTSTDTNAETAKSDAFNLVWNMAYPTVQSASHASILSLNNTSVLQYQQMGVQDINYMVYANQLQYMHSCVILNDDDGILYNYLIKYYSATNGCSLINNNQSNCVHLLNTAIHLNSTVLLVVNSNAFLNIIIDAIVHYNKIYVFIKPSDANKYFISTLCNYKYCIKCSITSSGVELLINHSIQQLYHQNELAQLQMQQVDVQLQLQQLQQQLLVIISSLDIFHADVKQALIKINDKQSQLLQIKQETEVLTAKMPININTTMFAQLYMQLQTIRENNVNYGMPLTRYTCLIQNTYKKATDSKILDKDELNAFILVELYRTLYYSVFEQHRSLLVAIFPRNVNDVIVKYVVPSNPVITSGIVIKNVLAHFHLEGYKTMQLSEYNEYRLQNSTSSGKIHVKECHMDINVAKQCIMERNVENAAVVFEFEPVEEYVGYCTFVDVPSDLVLLITSLVNIHGYKQYPMLLIHGILKKQCKIICIKDYNYSNTDLEMALRLTKDSITVSDIEATRHLLVQCYGSKIEDELDMMIIEGIINNVLELKLEFDNLPECLEYTRAVHIKDLLDIPNKQVNKLSMNTNLIDVSNISKTDKSDNIMVQFLKYMVKTMDNRYKQEYIQMIVLMEKNKLDLLPICYKMNGLIQAYKYHILEKTAGNHR
eukprot:NODE_282_length_11867_cov_0.266995.p1 type:complete len:2718 gc:universal NODE_282_length_11867_cov_0.266995:328-8481(+)